MSLKTSGFDVKISSKITPECCLLLSSCLGSTSAASLHIKKHLRKTQWAIFMLQKCQINDVATIKKERRDKNVFETLSQPRKQINEIARN